MKPSNNPYHNDADVFLESDPGPVGYDFGDGYNDTLCNPGFDIDVPLSTINVFAAQQRARPPPNPDPSIRLPDSIFSKLSQEDKRTWSRLGVDARRLILGYSNSSTTTVHPGSSINNPSNGLSNVNRRVHMSEHTSTPMLTLVAHYGLRRGPTFSVIVTEFRYGTVTVSESLKLTNMIQEFSAFFAIISIKSDSITKFLYEGRSIDIKEQHEYIVYRKRRKFSLFLLITARTGYGQNFRNA